MATPHIAGVVALVKQKNPTWSASAIHSALQTTASTVDMWNNTIMAEQPSASPTSTPLGPASPFDMGSGAINVTAAMDPGLVFERGNKLLPPNPNFENPMISSLPSIRPPKP